MLTHKWIGIDDTHILVQLQTHGERQEWHPVAQVTLRQIYAEVQPMYYSWRTPGMEMIGRSETLEEAIQKADRAVGR